MADIPPHLLERSKARRSALGGGEVSDGGSSAPPPAAASAPGSGVAVAAASEAPVAPRPTGGAAKAPVASPPTPAAPARPKIPLFALPVLLLLPLWALFYAGNFIKDVGNVETPEKIGARLYSTNCASCHNANGSGTEGGGIGRPLWNGEAELTFKTDAAQVAFVRLGSDACIGKSWGDPNRPGGKHIGKGKMPGGWSAISDAELGHLIAYERNNLSGKAFPTTTLAVGVVPTTIAATVENVCPS